MKTSVLILATAFVCLAAAQCGYNSPSGEIDLSAVPVATLNIQQVYQGVTTMYTYVIDLCSAVNQPPAGTSVCTDGAGYVSEYSSTQCETTWTTQTQGWTYDSTKGAGTASFTNSKGWLATILIGCGSTPELTAAGKVEVTDSLAFTFLLTTSAACGGAPPSPPGPTPLPPAPPAPVNKACDIGGSTVSQLGTAVLTINQEFNKQVQPFVWVIDLCRGTQFRPSGDAGICENSNPGYIKEYTPVTSTAPPQCLKVFDVKGGYSIVNGNWTAKYASSTSKWSATVTGVCDSNLTGLVSVGPAVVTGSFNSGFHFAFKFISKSFCLTKTPAPGPLPPGPGPNPPATNGTVTRLMCKESGCRQCTGDVLPIGSCVPASASSTASEKALSCSSQTVTIDTWSSSSSCGNSFFPAQTSWPVGKCIEVGPSDYRFYTCSP